MALRFVTEWQKAWKDLYTVFCLGQVGTAKGAFDSWPEALIINDSPFRLLERYGQERMETIVNRVWI